MTWTKEIPREPGLYWKRCTGELTVVQLSVRPSGEVEIQYPGDDSFYNPVKGRSEWQGPLSPQP
jgi:hypothetical protein